VIAHGGGQGTGALYLATAAESDVELALVLGVGSNTVGWISHFGGRPPLPKVTESGPDRRSTKSNGTRLDVEYVEFSKTYSTLTHFQTERAREY
jgi:Na+/glutamate symporter